MKNSSNIDIIKVNNDSIKTNPTQISRNFPNMPQLYLELIENKNKILPDKVNKEYIPDTNSEFDEILSQQNIDPREKVEPSQSKTENLDSSSLEDDEDDEDEDEDDEEEDEEDDDEDEEDDDEDDEDDEKEDEDVNEQDLTSPSEPKSNITNKLYELLKEDAPPPISNASTYEPALLPPKLSELEQSGQVRRDTTIPDYTNHPQLNDEEQDELKRELLFKFELLKKTYKNVEIPEFTMHSDYMNMKRAYETTLRRVQIENNVESYKTYLIGGFMVMEFILGHWLKFDMQGFTQQQILNMTKYERLLIELGEKNYIPEGQDWPVEVRLLFMIIINAGVFIIGKLIMKKTGTNFMSMMNSMNTFNQVPIKRKMKGPSIDVSNLPDEL